jgi:hypothetical protein
LRGSWMEFLQIQFGLHRSASELQKDPSVRIRSACQA